jgi:prepilin-type N-terminal cleavage/methylation domain-containing protein/prepilin-type processing-associated H-X9-DG protein
VFGIPNFPCYNADNRRVYNRRKLGFTLIELLVVLAILSVLAGIMFPVLRLAVDAAKRTKCLSNYEQVGRAMALYLADYDDRVPPVNYRRVDPSDPGTDRNWVQTLLPYAGSIELFQCPSDYGRAGTVAPPSFTLSSDAWRFYYDTTLRSNLGFNYMYLSPLVQLQGRDWRSFPVQLSAVTNQSETLMFIDSIWDRSAAGLPFGGGSWVVIPPCRYRDDGVGSGDDTFVLPPGTQYYFGFVPVGWQPASANTWLTYGGAWPWHKGRFNMLYVDGRAATVTVNQLVQGCDFQDKWRGLIKEPDQYIWDLN